MRVLLRDVDAIAGDTAEAIHRAAWGDADLPAELAKRVAERLAALVQDDVAGVPSGVRPVPPSSGA